MIMFFLVSHQVSKIKDWTIMHPKPEQLYWAMWFLFLPIVYRAYYQTRDFTVLSDAYAIRWKSGKVALSPNQYLFMVMCINKVTDLPIYSYKNKLGGWNVVKTKDIRLPEKNGKIDFAFMDTFISAIKKLAIKEVVLYSDRKIAATKELVSKNN